MDHTTQATLDQFFRAAPLGQVDVTMAGDPAQHRMGASLAEVGSFVSWNQPGEAVTVNLSSVLDTDPGINLGSLAGPAEPGPQVRGVNYAAIKPRTPGLS